MSNRMNSPESGRGPVWSYSLEEVRRIAHLAVRRASPRYDVSHVGRCNRTDMEEPFYILWLNGVGVLEDDVDDVLSALAEEGFSSGSFVTILNNRGVF